MAKSDIKEENSFEHLMLLTKEQIVGFLEKNFFHNPPSKRDVKFYKWEVLSAENQRKMDEHCENTKNKALAKEIDRLSEKLNFETDRIKKFKIFNKQEKLMGQLKSFHDRFDELMKERDKIDLLIK